MPECPTPECRWTATYWWHSADGRKRIGLCFGHATARQQTGGWRERKHHGENAQG